jgi:hypothetical protein
MTIGDMDEIEDDKQATVDVFQRVMQDWHEAHPNVTLAEIEQVVEMDIAKLRQRLIETLLNESGDDDDADAV